MDTSNDVYFIKQGVVRLSLNFVFENTVKLPMQNEGGLEYVNKISTKVV